MARIVVCGCCGQPRFYLWNLDAYRLIRRWDVLNNDGKNQPLKYTVANGANPNTPTGYQANNSELMAILMDQQTMISTAGNTVPTVDANHQHNPQQTSVLFAAHVR